MPGSVEYLRRNACVHRLDLGLYSQSKEVFFFFWWGRGGGGGGGRDRVRSHVHSKGKIPSTGKILLRGGSNPRRYIKQDSEPETLPTSYSGLILRF